MNNEIMELVKLCNRVHIEDDEFFAFADRLYRAAYNAGITESAELCDRFQARDVGMQPAECAGAIRQLEIK